MKNVITLIVVAVIASTASATILIDDFISTSPAGGWALTPVTLGTAVTKAETGLAGVYGGTRDTAYTVYGSLSASMTMGDGWYTQNNNTVSWSKATLTYNGGNDLALDLTSGTKFLVDAWFDHVGFGKNTVFSITLNDGSNSATVSKVWTTYQALNVQMTETFLFTNFLTQNPALNLSSINSIMLYLETDKAGDYALLTGFSTDAIPEPATMALLGLGALVFGRKKA